LNHIHLLFHQKAIVTNVNIESNIKGILAILLSKKLDKMSGGKYE